MRAFGLVYGMSGLECGEKSLGWNVLGTQLLFY